MGSPNTLSELKLQDLTNYLVRPAGLVISATEVPQKSRNPGEILFAVLAALVLSFLIPMTARAQSTSAIITSTMQVPAPSPTPSAQRKVAVRWKLDLSGDNFANEKEQAQTAGFGVSGELRYHLVESLDFKAAATVSMQSGYAQTRFGDNAPVSGIFLKEAYIQYHPFQVFALQAGALDQGLLRSPLLVSERSFPGAAEKIVVGDKHLGVEARAEQTIPTSASMTTRTVDAEPSPTFTAESLIVNVMPSSGWLLKAAGTHYAFHQLPSQVAVDSSLYGNTLDPDGLHFKYQYDGYVGALGTQIRIFRGFQWNIDGQLLKNTAAPQGYGDGQLISSSIDLTLSNNVTLKPQGEIFFAESDVSPAFYNDSAYGHSNRQGWAAELGTTFKSAGFKVVGRYVNANVINASLIQSSQQYIMLRFETLYASIL